MQCLKVMLPIEPRLKPLGATIIHYSDSETKAKFTRCHSFSGYVPYFLSDEPNEPIDCGPSPVTPPSNCSNRGVPLQKQMWAKLPRGHLCGQIQMRKEMGPALVQIKPRLKVVSRRARTVSTVAWLQKVMLFVKENTSRFFVAWFGGQAKTRD